MKARLFIVFVLVAGLTLLVAWGAAAQGPGDGRRAPDHGPAGGYPPDVGAGLDGKLVPHTLQAAPAVGVGAQGVSAMAALGQPGLSFRYVKTFGITDVAYFDDSAHLFGPYGVGTDGANVWIAEGDGRRALKYTSDGAYVTQIGQAGFREFNGVTLAYLTDVTVDAGGNTWVVDSDASHVIQFNSSGSRLRELGVAWEGGDANDRFNGPNGIAFDGAGNIYVSDTWNHRVQAFTSGGTYLTTIGVTGDWGSDNARLNSPRHIAIDSNNRLYVADADNQRVQIFDVSNVSAITYLATLGTTGTAGSDTAHFDGPAGVAVDVARGRIYVADGNNERVQVFNYTTWAYQGTSGDLDSYVDDVAVDTAGNVYVAEPWTSDNKVEQFDYSLTSVQRTYGQIDGTPYETDGAHYDQPSGVAVAPDGSLYIGESKGQRLIKLSAAGTLLWTVGEPGRRGSASDNDLFRYIQDVDLDAAGRVVVADEGNCRVQIYNSDGSYYATLGAGCGTGTAQFNRPRGVAVGPGGTLYVADADNQRVQVFNSSRAYVATIGQTGVSGSDNTHFNYPQDVDVDAAGNLYVVDQNNHRVQVFNSSRAYLRTIGVSGVSGDDFGHLSNPTAVTVDAGGRIYVADQWGSRVQVLDSSGAYLTTIGNWGSLSGQMRDTHGLDVDAAGNLYIADTENHRVQKFAPGVPGWAQTNLNGFGDPHNSQILTLAPFGGQLYAGTYNSSGGAQLWRTGSPWTAVMTNGFGSAANIGIDHLIEFKDNLYAGTWADAVNGGEIWRSGNGLNWTRVISRGFGDPTNGEVYHFAVFSNTLYATTWSYTTTHGGEVWRSSTGDGDDWSRVVSNGFDGDPANLGVTAMEVFSDHLYAGTENWNSGTQTSSGGEIWRTGDGSVWTQVDADMLGPISSTAVSALAGFDGYLYASTIPPAGVGAQVWRCQVCAGSDWQQVVNNGFGNSSTRNMSALESFDGQLYFVVGNTTTGLEVWRSATGDSGDWKQIGFAGWGDSNNRAPYWDNPVAVFDDALFIGDQNYATGGEVWVLLDKQVYLPAVLQNR